MEEIALKAMEGTYNYLSSKNGVGLIIYFLTYLVILLVPFFVYGYMYFRNDNNNRTIGEIIGWAFIFQFVAFILISSIIGMVEYTSKVDAYTPSKIFLQLFGNGEVSLYQHWNNQLSYISNNYIDYNTDLSKFTETQKTSILGSIYIIVLILTIFEVFAPYIFIFVLYFSLHQKIRNSKSSGYDAFEAAPIREYTFFILGWIFFLFLVTLHVLLSELYLRIFIGNELVNNYSVNILKDINYHTSTLWGLF